MLRGLPGLVRGTHKRKDESTVETPAKEEAPAKRPRASETEDVAASKSSSASAEQQDGAAVMELARIEQERHRLFGGTPLQRTVEVLGSIGVSQITPGALNDLLKAVLADVCSDAMGRAAQPQHHESQKPQQHCASPPVASLRAASPDLRPRLQPISLDSLEDTDAFAPPPPFLAGDCLLGSIEAQAIRLRIVRQDGELSAHIYLQQTSGLWQRFGASIITSDLLGCMRWNVQFEMSLEAATGIPPSLPMQLSGSLQDRHFVTDHDLQLEVVRRRAAVADDDLPWMATAQVLQEQWQPCNEILHSVKQKLPQIRQHKKWNKDLAALEKQWSSVKEGFMVLFIGASGAGKSKLLNQMLGDDDFLPSAGEGAAVTASPIELCYRPMPPEAEDEAPGEVVLYDCKFTLLSIREFTETRDKMIKDLVEFWEGAEYEDVPKKKPPEEEIAARTAHDWLESVYGTKSFQRDWPDSSSCRESFQSIPAELKKGQLKEFQAKLPQELLTLLMQWLVCSKDRRETGQLWPLVKWASVAGPWPVLSGGIRFVDLPGFGDANVIRDRIAKQQYSKADFVCICSRIDRASTDRASQEWLARAVRDQPRGRVAYICTKADDIAKDEVIRDNPGRLTRTSSRLDAARVRNEKVKAEVQSKHDVKVFTVSARDFARCVGREGREPETCTTVASTEVPQLLSTIVNQLMSEFVKERFANFKALSAQVKLMEAQLRERPDAELDPSVLEKRFAELLQQLESKLERYSARAQSQMASQSRRLEASVAAAAVEGQRQVPAAAARLGTGTPLHWNTHKAWVVRDGDWPERGMNMAKDVSAEVMSNLDSEWVDIFNAAPDIASELQRDLCTAVQAVINEFGETLEEWPGLQEHASVLGSTVSATVQSHLDLNVKNFDTFVQECRKGYGEEVIEDTQSQLPPLLQPAKFFAGTGSVKLRKESVTTNLKNVNLTSSVEKPKARCQRVSDHFRTVARQMTAVCMSEVGHCYTPLWESKDFQPEKEREAKATFRCHLESKVATVTYAVDAACAAWPIQL